MKLRDYQEECIGTISSYFQKKDKQLIQLPTGSGKTFIFLEYLRRHSNKSLIIVPTKELTEQIYDNGLKFFHKSEIFRKTRNRMSKSNHYIVTAQSLPFKFMKEWVRDQKFDHIIIDEAHRAHSKTYTEFLELYESYGYSPKVIGFTATPERFDRKCLLDIFGEITFDRTFYDLIKSGYLCDIEGYRIRTKINLKKSTRNSSDFSGNDLRKLDNSTRNGIIIDVYQKNCADEKTLIFCVSVDNARTLAAALCSKGYKAEAVYGDMPYSERQGILKRFKSGETQVVCNCQLLTEGFDEPSIQNLIIARPTRSKALYCQMIGRAVRLFPGKDVAKVYELTDNSHDICTFDTAAGADRDGKREYKDGQRLTEIHQELVSIDLSDISTEEEEFSFFEDAKDYFSEIDATERQIKLLRDQNIPWISPLNYMEAAFLLWKQKLRIKYGISSQ